MKIKVVSAILVSLLYLSLLFAGCASRQLSDITSEFSREGVLGAGYKVGATYILQRELFVTRGDWPVYAFTKPGDGVPTGDEWRAGKRAPQFFEVVLLLPAGTKLRVESVGFLQEKGSGVSHATGMLRAGGVDQPINPFFISDLRPVQGYGTLCVPDSRYLVEDR